MYRDLDFTSKNNISKIFLNDSKMQKMWKKHENDVSKFCSLECAYSFSELDAETYLMLRIT